jgi:predicted TIM-barrel fold metal-dependent hydrolase
MRGWSILLGIILVSTGASAQQVPPARRIIDVHLHAYTHDERLGSRITVPITGELLVAARDAADHQAATFAAMKRLNVVKAVVSGGDRDAELRWKQVAPDQIIIGYNIGDPTKVDLALLRREHAAGRLQVIGEVGAQYEGILPNDPRMEPLYSLAEQLDVPIGLHIHPGPPGAPYPPFSMTKMRANSGHPLLLEDALVRHPKLRLYVMHAGWPFLDEMKALLYEHPQVYVDVAVIGWSQPRPEFYRFLRGLVEAGYARRIMFGSDQMVWSDRIEKTVESIEQADFLTAQQKEDIFYNNAARFLRLEPK